MKSSEWFWNWSAKRYDKRAQEDETYPVVVGRMSKYLKPDHRVLDFGCGTGVIALKVAADVNQVHGIDTSSGMIDLATQRARESGVVNAHFVRNSIFDEECERHSYDAILAFNILHLLEDARRAVRRASELLKPGGVMVSMTPCLGEAGVVLRTILPLVSRVGILSYLRSFRISEVQELMVDGDLESEESEVLGAAIPSCFLVARKRG